MADVVCRGVAILPVSTFVSKCLQIWSENKFKNPKPNAANKHPTSKKQLAHKEQQQSNFTNRTSTEEALYSNEMSHSNKILRFPSPPLGQVYTPLARPSLSFLSFCANFTPFKISSNFGHHRKPSNKYSKSTLGSFGAPFLGFLT